MARRCEIIAEIGINHNGDMNIAKELIKFAKGAGADVAKFQVYNPRATLKKTEFNAMDWEIIEKTELKPPQIEMLMEYCKEVGIGFLASAFDLERLKWLEQMGVKRHKIASRSVFDRKYVEAVQDTGKPYLVSTGWVNPDRCRLMGESVLETLERVDAPNAKILYCVSKYPSLPADLKFYSDMFHDGIYDGFSDHSQGIFAAVSAIVLGAKVVEKHFTLDKLAPGPDHLGSAIFPELQSLCGFRDAFQQLDWRFG